MNFEICENNIGYSFKNKKVHFVKNLREKVLQNRQMQCLRQVLHKNLCKTLQTRYTG